jgi:hypothetical protein
MSMKAINIDNLKRLKRALQKEKLRSIDSIRIEVARHDSQKQQQKD